MLVSPVTPTVDLSRLLREVERSSRMENEDAYSEKRRRRDKWQRSNRRRAR